MNKQAICIQCHKNPEQINFLISRFPREFFDFYIHVDLKSDIIDYINKKENVYFVANRLDVQWGRFSQVEATLELLKMVKTNEYSYVHLISGNDCMIKPVDYFLDVFSSDNRKEYIQSNILPGSCTWSWSGEDRYSCWYPPWIIHRPAHKSYRLLRISYRELVMRTRFLKRKSYPVNYFYGGSSWFSLTGECVCWMMEYLLQHRQYISFFQHSVCSDEVFFSTLIRESPYAGNIANNPLRFMIWKGTFSGGPKDLEYSDISKMKDTDCVFARKVTNIEVMKEIYDALCV